MEIIQIGEHAASHIPWFAWIALAAILCGSFTAVVKLIVTHRERLAMIRAGIDPDAPHRKPIYDDVDVR